jgi:hypothetical protein
MSAPEDAGQPAAADQAAADSADGIVGAEPARGLPTETKLFGSIGVCYLVIAAIYGATAQEAAGFVMLLLGGAFALTVAGFTWFSVRSVQHDVQVAEDEVPDAPPDHGDLYLPHTSIWPLGIAMGAAITIVGIAVGWWVILPGAALLVHSIIGFAAQSRDRT